MAQWQLAPAVWAGDTPTHLGAEPGVRVVGLVAAAVRLTAIVLALCIKDALTRARTVSSDGVGLQRRRAL